MNIVNEVSQIKPIVTAGQKQVQISEKSSNALFENFYNVAKDMYSQTNQYQLQAEQLQLDYATGITDDMLAVSLANRKAQVSLNFSIQVTNRVVDAYKEILRMQV